MLQNRGLGAQGIQQAKVGKAVADGDIQEAQRRAMWLWYANVRSEKAKIAWEKEPRQTLPGSSWYTEASHRQGRQVPYLLN